MKKRILALIAAFSFFFSATTFAYQKDSYYEDLKVGLENMMSSSIEVTLNGNYKFNDNLLLSGTSYVLNFNNGKVNMNGTDYDNIMLIPENKDCTLKLKVGAKVYSYPGLMNFMIKGSSIIPVNSINIEEYLKGVVGYEMSNSYPIEALKAQAVAARNYALSNKGKHSSDGYDVCDTTDCQVYKGYNPLYTNVIKAVEDTKGMVLLYNDEYVNAYYSSSDGGFIENISDIWGDTTKPYLTAKADEFDTELWPYGDMLFKTPDIDAKLKGKGYLPGDSTLVKIDLNTIVKYPSGRVQSIEAVYKDGAGNEQRIAFTKDKARTFLSLPSSLYTVTYDQSTDTYTFSGRGYGHGLGMSQIGAKNRANAGQTYDSILTFYYDGTYLKQLLSDVKNLLVSRKKVLKGDGVFFTVEGDNGGSLYKFAVERDNNIVFTKDFSADTSVLYNPDKAGNYRVHLYIRNSGSGKEYDDEKVMEFTAYDLPEISALTVAPQAITGKNPISITASSTGGTGDLMYRFEILKDNVQVAVQDYSNINSFTYTPEVSGLYKARVYVKDGISSREYDSMKEADLNLGGTPAAVVDVKGPLKITRTLKKGMKGDDIKSLQQYLLALGYQIGSANGEFNDKTNTAVQDFQRKNGINPSGIVGVKTVAAINKKISAKNTASSSIPSRGETSAKTKPTFKIQGVLKKGSTGNDVKNLQEALKYLSYNVDVNGNFDSKTETAVKSFQKINKLTADGIVGLQTAKAIEGKLK